MDFLVQASGMGNFFLIHSHLGEVRRGAVFGEREHLGIAGRVNETRVSGLGAGWPLRTKVPPGFCETRVQR